MDEILYPLVRGDYVIRDYDDQVARVRTIWWDAFEKEFCANLTIIRHSGDVIGRASMVCGGPRDFEPAVVMDATWRRIEEPQFPIYVPLKWVDDGTGTLVARKVPSVTELPFRKHKKRKKKPKTRIVSRSIRSAISDFDPDLEAASRRLAAQNMRDLARNFDTDIARTMRETADRLDKEADGIKPRF